MASPLGYRPALDGLRALAILLVLVHHTSRILVGGWAFDHVLPGGFVGVDVFFVLSGFLITTLLLERRDEPRALRRFYARRALRLLPALAVLLAALVVLAAAEGTLPGDVPRTILAVGTYWANWAPLAGVGIDHHVGHLWSLSIEEQFYALWPLLLFGALALTRSRRQLVAAALGLAVAAALWRAARWQADPNWLRTYLRTDLRLDTLLAGAALALAPRRALPAAVGAAGLAGVLGVALAVPPDAAAYYDGLLTFVAVAAAALLAALLRSESALARAFAHPAPVWIGRLSYSLYLWHFGVFVAVADHLGGRPWELRVLVGWAATFALAWLSYAFVETPFLRRKRAVGAPA